MRKRSMVPARRALRLGPAQALRAALLRVLQERGVARAEIHCCKMGTMALDHLQLFLAVAETASFSAAARQLGLPKSTVSRGVAALEKELGARLLHRTTRHVALSTAGVALRDRIGAPFAALARAASDLPDLDEEPAGLLRVTATVDFGAVVLADIIAGFVARYPSVAVELHLTNAVVDLVAEGIDVALRMSIRRLADSSFLARRLAPMEMQVYAAPAYLARRGVPRSPRDLDSHEWVMLRGAVRLRLEARGRTSLLKPRGRVSADDMSFIHRAARAGAGLAVLPTFLANANVASGELVRVMPRWSIAGGHVWMVTPARQYLPKKVTAFREALLEGMQPDRRPS